MTLSAQSFITQYLPTSDVEFRLYSIATGEYLTEWEPLPANKTVDFGFYDIEVPEYPKDVYFSVYTGTGLAIQQQLVKFYINEVRKDFGYNRIENMTIIITIKDFFNTTLFNQMINTSGIYEYDMLINLFSLKIKNNAEKIVSYELILGSLTETGSLFPYEIVEYQLSSTNYELMWINNEDGSTGTFSFNLNEDKLYMINTTYHDVYFALYNFYGIVNKEEVRFYINNTRSDFGFNTIKSDYVNLLVLDFFNSTI